MPPDVSGRLSKDPAFVRYVVARILSLVGNIITLVALPVLVYRLSGSSFLTALVAGLEAAPYAVFGLFAGALSDRWNRKTVMVTADILSACLLASIPAAYFLDALTVPHILFVASPDRPSAPSSTARCSVRCPCWSGGAGSPRPTPTSGRCRAWSRS